MAYSSQGHPNAGLDDDDALTAALAASQPHFTVTQTSDRAALDHAGGGAAGIRRKRKRVHRADHNIPHPTGLSMQDRSGREEQYENFKEQGLLAEDPADKLKHRKAALGLSIAPTLASPSQLFQRIFNLGRDGKGPRNVIVELLSQYSNAVHEEIARPVGCQSESHHICKMPNRVIENHNIDPDIVNIITRELFCKRGLAVGNKQLCTGGEISASGLEEAFAFLWLARFRFGMGGILIAPGDTE